MVERRGFELPEGKSTQLLSGSQLSHLSKKNKTQGSFVGFEPTKNFIQQNFINYLNIAV